MRRHGFATFMAVVMLGAMGISIAALSLMVQIDARRTRDAARQAQLRQLLLAGERAAAQQLAGADVPAGPVDVQLPSSAAAYDLTLAFDQANDQAVVVVTAAGEETTAQQRLTYRRDSADRWRLEAADLLRQR